MIGLSSMLFSFFLGFFCTLFVGQFFQTQHWVVLLIGLLLSLLILVGALCVHGAVDIGELVIVVVRVSWSLVLGVFIAAILHRSFAKRP